MHVGTEPGTEPGTAWLGRGGGAHRPISPSWDPGSQSHLASPVFSTGPVLYGPPSPLSPLEHRSVGHKTPHDSCSWGVGHSLQSLGCQDGCEGVARAGTAYTWSLA